MSKGHPQWFDEMPHRDDLHVFPWPGTADKQHVPRPGCWCRPTRWEHDQRVLIHLPSIAVWDRK